MTGSSPVRSTGSGWSCRTWTCRALICVRGAADGRPLDFLVPEDVLAEIRYRRMYEPAAAAHGQGRR